MRSRAILIFAMFSIASPAIQACGESAGTMTTKGATIVLARPTPGFYSGPNEVIGMVPAGETRPVRELHYGKDYLMLEVEFAPGTVGYVDAADVEWSHAAR